MVAERNSTIRKAVNTLYEISADEKVRAEYEWKQKARMDTEAIIGYRVDKAVDEAVGKAVLDTRQEIAQKLKRSGTPIEQIAQVTGLTDKQIEEL